VIAAVSTSPRRRARTLLSEAGGPVRWPEVLRALQADDSRSYALTSFRSGGFSADSFGAKTSPSSRPAREAMANALTATEDWLELEHPVRWRRERDAIRAIRRRLEWELWL
jgi:hypothetical protein